MLVASALVALTTTGCATSGSRVPLPPPTIPADLAICFDTAVPAPKAGPMSKSKVIALVTALKVSETEKINCGKRLIKFHNE